MPSWPTKKVCSSRHVVAFQGGCADDFVPGGVRRGTSGMPLTGRIDKQTKDAAQSGQRGACAGATAPTYGLGSKARG
jgi:hypothetical protein